MGAGRSREGEPVNVGFVGMGNMGQMLVTALAQNNVLAPGAMVASNRSPEKLQQIAKAVPGIQVAYTNGELARRCRTIFLCLKPGETRDALNTMAPYITADHLLVLINNTIDIAQLEAVTPARVAKVIPSLLHAIGAGVSLVMFGRRCEVEDKQLLLRLMSGISQPQVIEEHQARVCSDLTSCGPAFFSHIFRALAEAARHYQPDLAPETVCALIRETALATFRMMEQQGLSFADVIARVSTPGGITADGIKVLDEAAAGLWERVIETTIAKEKQKRAGVEL
jgi:competence protein ComER